MAMRKAKYRLYPNAAQTAALDVACELHRKLYNAALEERFDAYRKAGLSIGYCVKRSIKNPRDDMVF